MPALAPLEFQRESEACIGPRAVNSAAITAQLGRPYKAVGVFRGAQLTSMESFRFNSLYLHAK